MLPPSPPPELPDNAVVYKEMAWVSLRRRMWIAWGTMATVVNVAAIAETRSSMKAFLVR